MLTGIKLQYKYWNNTHQTRSTRHLSHNVTFSCSNVQNWELDIFSNYLMKVVNCECESNKWSFNVFNHTNDVSSKQCKSQYTCFYQNKTRLKINFHVAHLLSYHRYVPGFLFFLVLGARAALSSLLTLPRTMISECNVIMETMETMTMTDSTMTISLCLQHGGFASGCSPHMLPCSFPGRSRRCWRGRPGAGRSCRWTLPCTSSSRTGCTTEIEIIISRQTTLHDRISHLHWTVAKSF